MKSIRLLITASMMLFISLGASAQTKTYYSSNKSFSVAVPNYFYLYQEALPYFLSFKSESPKGMMSMERIFVMTDEDFANYVSKDKASIPSKFKCTTVSSSTNFHHLKYSKGMFVTHKFYMRRVIEGYSYVINLCCDGMTEDTAKIIMNSIKAY